MYCVFFFKQKTAYEIGTGDWSSDVCSSDLIVCDQSYCVRSVLLCMISLIVCAQSYCV